jgi:hypothetical protein
MTADNDTETEAPKNDAEFVKQYAAKMEAQEKAAAAGKEKPPAPAAKKEDADDDAGEDEEGADSEEEAAAGESDSEEDEHGEGDADDDAGGEAGDEKDKAEAKGKKDEEEDDEEGDEDSDTEFDRAAKSAKLPTRLDDLPEEARPVVEKRLKDMEAGFTRLSQQATEFRAEQREFRAEERYREAHPAEFLASMLVKDPALEDQVATLLEKLRDDEDPTSREAAAALEKQHRDDAAEEIAKAEKVEREQSQQLEARISEVETLARAACKKNGISFDRGVEAAIAYEIRDQGDIENDRIKEIVDEMAAERGRSQRAVKREERKRIIQGKTEAARRASPMRPGTGRAGGSSRPPAKELTLEENMKATAARLFAGEPEG